MDNAQKYLVVGTLLIIINLIIFFIPNQVSLFGFSLDGIKSGKFYSVFTFMFSHLNISHLILNLAGILLGLVLYLEYKFKVLEYIFIYFISGLLSVLVMMFFFPNFVFLGASACVYGTFGALSLKKKFRIPRCFLFGAFLLSIYLPLLVNYLNKTFSILIVNQAYLHTCAFFIGALVFIILKMKGDKNE